MKRLPLPEDVRRAFRVPGLFEPVAHQFVSSGVEVFGRIAVDGRFLPVGFQVGPAPAVDAWPWRFRDLAMCRCPTSRRAPLLSSSAGKNLDEAARRLLENLTRTDWVMNVVSRTRTLSRSWTFELNASSRQVGEDLIRASSEAGHNDIYVQLHSNCLQRCSFCPTWTKKSSSGIQDSDLKLVSDLARLVILPGLEHGVTSAVRFDADDLSGHRHLSEMMSIVSDSCGCPMHLVIPANRLSSPAVAKTVTSLSGLTKLSTTIFGASADVHDKVAGRPGAFAETIKAIRNISSEPVHTQCHFVLTSGAVDGIGQVADILSHFGTDMMLQSLILDCEAHPALLDPILPDLAQVRAALERQADRILAAARVVGVEITDFPVCCVPARLRHLARTDHLRESLYRYRLTEKCGGCRYFDDCIGVSALYLEKFGLSGLNPEP